MSPARLVRAFLLLSTALFLPPLSQAQIPPSSSTTSTPVPGAGHDYLGGQVDSVNPANGSISLRIPVIMPPSRGISLPFSFAYDSNGVDYLTPPVGLGTRAFWATTNSTISEGGWSNTAPVLSDSELTWKTLGDDGHTEITCHSLINFVFQDSRGNRHNLNMSNYGDPSLTGVCSVNTQDWPPSFSGQIVYQGGEGSIAASMTAGWTPNPSVSVTDGDGTQLGFPVHAGFGGQSANTWLATSVIDRNGNTININASYSTPNNTAVFTYTDTAGRPVLQDSGFAASPETVTVSGLGGNYILTWTTLSTPNFSTPITPLSGSCTIAQNTWGAANKVVSNITLPNGQSYVFSYDTAYGLLNKVTYPSGGYVRYVWGMYLNAEIAASANCAMEYAIPAITDRYVSFDGVTEVEHQQFTYSPPKWNFPSSALWTSKRTTVTTYDLVRNTSSQTVYNYTGVGAVQPPNSGTPTAQDPVESSIAYYNDLGATLLNTVNKGWINERMLAFQQDVLPNGQSSLTVYCYNSSELEIEHDDYDFGNAAATLPSCSNPNIVPPGTVSGSLLRKTVTNYAASTAMAAAHVIDRPASIIVDDGGNNKAAETDFAYDSPSGTATSGVVQHGAGCNCGNLTSESHWLNTSGSDLTTSYTNDDTGQRLSMTDPRGNITTYSYADNYSSGSPSGPTNAYLTQLALPNTGVAHTEKFSYAYASGELTSSTDQNNQVTNYKYIDSLARLTETDFPDGGKTTLAYNDAPYNPQTPSPSVTAAKAITSSTNLTTLTAFDGLGHTVRSVLTSDPDCPTGDRTDTAYDGLGRVLTVSNSYCTTSDPTYGTTSYTYDALGRTLKVTQPDNSTILTSYTGRATEVQDEGNGTSNVTRISQSDALGRLTSVCEVSNTTQIGQDASPATCPQDIGGSGFLTSYQYDVLGNLRLVNQDTMPPRSFAYDSLSRLTTATNPESGTITYSYDANGNLISKTAPAPNIASSTSTLIGTQSIASSPDNNTPGSAEAFQVTAASTGELSSITVYIDTPNTATQLFAGIYSDSSGQPGTLLTQGSSGSLQAGAWNTVEVPAISLTAGTPYWIAILASSGTVAFRDGTGCTSISSQEENLTSLPDSWTSGQSYPTCPLSAYGSGEALNSSTTVTTAYQYDALNRLTQKTYNDNLTQSAAYYYDSYSNRTFANSIGRLVLSGTSSPVGGCIDTFTSYDPMGRVSEEWQYLPSFPNCDATYSMPYTYDLVGDMTSYFNGYFNPISATYNTAGRLTTLTPSSYGWYGSAPANFLSNATYNAAGQITSDTLGTIENETFGYDKRMRLQSESSTLISTNTQDYSFNLTFAPDGDVLSANDSVNGNWNYSYDQLNRLVCANLASNGTCPASGAPTYSYVYDRFGNRWQQNGPLSFSATFTGNSPSSPQNNNRIDGFTYDAAGNLLNDGLHTYFYDAENRLVQVDGSLGDCSSTTTLAHATACYYYDANGRRVWRTGFNNDHNCGGDTTGQRGYIYDLAGHWLTSVNKVSGTGCPGEIYAGSRHVASDNGDTTLDHTDWLGTSRVRTDYQYTSSHGFWIGQSCTSLPFGDGLDCNSANYFPLHFTGKERDAESGLDNFSARFDSSSLGRFMSPDPIFFQVSMLADPQQWNEYAYVRNNPLSIVDPAGEAIELTCQQTDPDKCEAERQKELNALKNAVGQQAGQYLYENKVTTTDENGNTTTSYYVGVYANGPTGSGPSFTSINSVSKAIGDIISDSRVALLDVVPAGTSITNDKGGRVTIGPADSGPVGATYTGQDGKMHVTLLDTTASSPGMLPAWMMYPPTRPGAIDSGIIAGHEFGHVRYDWGGFWRQNFDSSNRSALRLENAVRRLKDPNGEIRNVHD